MSLTDWVGIAALLLLTIVVGVLLRLRRKMRGGQCRLNQLRVCAACSLAVPATVKRCAYCGHTNADAWGRKLLSGLASLLLMTGVSTFGAAFLASWIQTVPSQLPSLQAWVRQFPSALSPAPRLVLLDVPRSASVMPPLMEMHEAEALKMSTPPALPPLASEKSSADLLLEQNAAPPPVSTPMPSPGAAPSQPLPTLNPFVSRAQSVSAEEPAQTAGAPATSLSESAGPMVMTCGGPVPASRPDPDFNAYLPQLQRQIRQHWSPPNMDRDKRVVIAYRVSCNGELLQARVLESSGIPAADQAGLTAIRQAAPFPPLPADYRGQAVEVQFAFDYSLQTRTATDGKK